MQYDVRALTPDHVLTRLRVEARDERDARAQVEARGLFAAAVQPVRAGLLSGLRGDGRGGGLQLVLFCQELLALLKAGLSLVECLEALQEKEAGAATRALLGRLLGALYEGQRLSAALAAEPNAFPPLFVGIVQAAEDTSDLPRALERFIDYQQRIDSVRGKIVSASIYPLILLAVGSGVSLFLIGYVVPRFAEVYQGAGRSLPWMSQLLLEWGKLVAAHPGTLLAVIALGLTAAWFGLARMRASGALTRLAARLPGIGERARIYQLSRLYLTLGMLQEGGIPIASALDSAQAVVPRALRPQLAAARAEVEAGAPLSLAFERHGLATPISLRMLRVGEHTGALGAMLSQSAAFYDGEISRWIDRFTRAFEPILMAAIGMVVGLIVILLYMPIFDLAGSLS